MSELYDNLNRLHHLLNKPPDPEIWKELSSFFVNLQNHSTKAQVDWPNILHYLLQQSPNHHLWESICNLFVAWPESNARSRALTDADQQLNHWDPFLRVAFADWMPLYNNGKITDLGQLMRYLRLYRMSEYSTDTLKAMSNSPYLQNLTHLSIYRCEDIDPEAFTNLALSPYIRRIKHLEIHNSHLGFIDDHFGPISSNDIDFWRTLKPTPMRVHFFDLVQSPVLANIHWLKLTSLSLENWYVQNLVQAQFAPQLEHLDLSNNYIDFEGVQILANTPHLQHLRTLKLNRNSIWDEGAEFLAQSPHLNNLQELHIVSTRITQKGRDVLQKSPFLQKTKIFFD